jgi:hypothetical protein
LRRSSSLSSEPDGEPAKLSCPSCKAMYPPTERFCADCGMPLIRLEGPEEQPVTDSHGRARKIKPQYIGGDLVKVGWARNQAEAELIQGLLLEEGIPSVQRRTQGFDVPQFLAAGPRDLLVCQSAYAEARELLSGADVSEAGAADSNGGAPLSGLAGSPARLLAWILVAAVLAVAVVYGLYELAA